MPRLRREERCPPARDSREGGPLKTEEDAFDPSPAKQQFEALAAIQILEQAILAAPLEGALMKYGNFSGPGDSDALPRLVQRRRTPIIRDGGGVWSGIHLDDAADATIAALESGLRGIYNVTDEDPARVAQWLPFQDVPTARASSELTHLAFAVRT
ncbi:MAG TPA: hypothetical protein VFS67_36540 [Polyangiaceae bacterium]|nr:hypothetical protein [Polyangiaceae bacterium]